LLPCPGCNLPNPPSTRFCSNCGRALLTPRSQTSPPPTRSSAPQNLLIGLVCFVGIVGLIRSCTPESTSKNIAASPRSDTPNTETAKTPSINLWDESEDTSAMDNIRTIILSRTSNDSFKAWIGTDTPRLIVQCHTKRRPDLLVKLGSAASVEYGTDLHTVRLRMDSGKPAKQYWPESKDGNGLFSPAPTALITELKKHQTMLFEFDPFNTPSTATVSFDLSGLEESMGKYPECKTK
jgi:hypothetical protein